MDNKSKKRPGGAEKHREKKPKSLEVEAAKCAKLTDLFGAGFTSPAAAGAPGDERGGLDNDERVEADMVPYCFKHFVQTEPSDSCVGAYVPMFSLMLLQKCNKLSGIQLLP
ncbi:unnamed protein product [Pleuronectes platessa]|uniref:Uncharacterized protein n=1 Tax=Pleuronectes platessa TaxID=8262 RepID=A0A9N7VXR9_PLEPL|nr:unnamed protein product [Pleuronectes platessa]